MRSATRLRTTLAAGLPVGIALAVVGAAPAAADPDAARVTASIGSTVSDGDALAAGGALEDGAGVETGDDGGCSLLVDEDAVMEMCGSTRVELARKDGDPDGPRVVNLEQGEIRMVVEPRLGEERIEIHTPAAIATILGTIVHISVDALGVTTVASSAARVLVTSADSSVPGSVTIAAGEQVSVSPGSPPADVTRLSSAGMAALGGCLIDFHAATVSRDGSRQARSRLQAAMQSAFADAAGPDVAAAAEEAALAGGPTSKEPPFRPGGANDPEAVFEGFNETFETDPNLPSDLTDSDMMPPDDGLVGGNPSPGDEGGIPVGPPIN